MSGFGTLAVEVLEAKGDCCMIQEISTSLRAFR